MSRILVIEDDPSVASALRDLLRIEGYIVDMAEGAAAGLAQAQDGTYDVVVTDLQMPGLSGLDIIKTLHTQKPYLPIILVTAFHTTETAINAIKLGAFDYLLKPIDPSELLALIKKALNSTSLLAKPVEMGEATASNDAIIGKSKVMQNLYKEIGRVAAMPVTVLLRGETGTGKELVARAIHQYSDRARQPFVAVNCSAIPESLLESELFGHEPGAFTDAKARRIGQFEQANHGTLFLDEIGDMTPGAQVKLLRVLQDRTIQRVGGKDTISVDVRIIAATHRNLEAAIEAKEFRADLFFRLNVATIFLPSLAERREDIPDLVHYFLKRYSAEFGVEPAPVITPEALDFLQNQTWPGNVRELENVVRKALIVARGFPINLELIQNAHRKPIVAPPSGGQSLAELVTALLAGAQAGDTANVHALLQEVVERELYGQAIRLANGDQSKAARWLGISRPTLRERLNRYTLFPVKSDVGGLPQTPSAAS